MKEGFLVYLWLKKCFDALFWLKSGYFFREALNYIVKNVFKITLTYS